jgi:hypothetical protein
MDADIMRRDYQEGWNVILDDVVCISTADCGGGGGGCDEDDGDNDVDDNDTRDERRDGGSRRWRGGGGGALCVCSCASFCNFTRD